MIIQDPPVEIPLTDKKGIVSWEWQQWFSRLAQSIQLNLSDDGYTLPQNTQADITGPLNTETQTGNMTYDSTNNVMAVNLNGTMVKVETTPYV